MKTIKNQLRYRCHRIIIPTILLILFYSFTLMPDTINMHPITLKANVLRQIPYSALASQDSRFYSLCLVISFIWVYQFYMMFQDIQRNKTRLLLLPRSRSFVWMVDASIFFVSTLLVLGVYFVIYAYGFEMYQEAVLEYSTFAYWQSSHVLTSLHETSGFVYLYPGDIAHWVYFIIFLKLLSYSLPFLYTITSSKKKNKYERVVQCMLMILTGFLLFLVPNVWLKSIVGVLFVMWMLHDLKDCWQSSRIGG